MTIFRNDQIQAGLISYTDANATILAELDDTDEIREDAWQGTEFTYPNIRIKLLPGSPSDDNCDHQAFRASYEVYSEEASSQQADRIAGIIANELHITSFNANSLRYYGVRVTANGLIPAIREDDRTWRSEVILQGSVQQQI